MGLARMRKLERNSALQQTMEEQACNPYQQGLSTVKVHPMIGVGLNDRLKRSAKEGPRQAGIINLEACELREGQTPGISQPPASAPSLPEPGWVASCEGFL